MANVRSVKVSPRKEAVREKNSVRTVSASLSKIKDHFQESLTYIENLSNVSDELVRKERTTDAEEIWRSQIAFLDSALDYFLHEITRYGTYQMFKNVWAKTGKYKTLNISMDILHNVLRNQEDSSWFEEFIRKLYELKCLMSYDAIDDHMKLLGLNIENIADKVISEPNNTNKRRVLEDKIRELYKRRNLIVHQFDRSRNTSQRNNINKGEVDGYILLVRKFVNVVCDEIAEKDASD